MPSIFTKIINGQIPGYIVAEDENFIAFLDINPLAIGHTLVVPKIEVDYIFDIDEQLFKSYWSFAKQVAHAIQLAVPCKKIGVTVIGLEVPHAHIHLIPINEISDMNFTLPKLSLPAADLQATAHAIASHFYV